MGGKKRNRFERIYTDSEEESSDEEMQRAESDDDISVKNRDNVNNSNSTAVVGAESMDTQQQISQGKIPENQSKSFQNEKFLITRSKRKYSKPDIKFKTMNKQKTF